MCFSPVRDYVVVGLVAKMWTLLAGDLDLEQGIPGVAKL